MKIFISPSARLLVTGIPIEGLRDGREGECTACGEEIDIAEKSYLNIANGWFLHKDCWVELNSSQT